LHKIADFAYISANLNLHLSIKLFFYCHEQTQLIDAVAVESGLTKVDARKAVDAFIKTTVEQLKQGEKNYTCRIWYFFSFGTISTYREKSSNRCET